MHKKIKKFLIILFILDIAIAILLLKSRTFSRLAIWNILEISDQKDLYWHPDKKPSYFYFEISSPELEIFKKEISPLLKEHDNDLEKLLIISNYLMNLSKKRPFKKIIWSSPLGILNQIKQGKQACCFEYSILFSTYLASIGLKSRLWALEGDDGLERFGHTVVEVYLKDLNKWVLFDVVNKIYFIEKNIPLSVLELRDRLLNKEIDDIKVKGEFSSLEEEKFINLYSRLLKMVFLRTANDFIHKYNSKIRYGKFYYLEKFFDYLPSDIRRGLNYILGRKDYLIHYVDKFDKTLKPLIYILKTIFYFFIISLSFIFFYLAISILNYLKNHLSF